MLKKIFNKLWPKKQKKIVCRKIVIDLKYYNPNIRIHRDIITNYNSIKKSGKFNDLCGC
jgi:hypothetical protein